MKRKSPAPVVIAGAAALSLFGMTADAADAADAAKPTISGAELAGAGRVVQFDGIGRNGEAFVAVLEDNQTVSGGGPDHRTHCLGIVRGAAGAIGEQINFCVETDQDGDQVLWKLTFAPHPTGAATTQYVREAIAGSGKYAGISMTQKWTSEFESTGPSTYKVKDKLTQ